MANMIIGLTGGIGSGKTTAAKAFGELGAPWVDVDIVAREVVEPGETALDQISERFGEAVLLDDGNLDRAALRQHIFNHPEDKQWLESLLHPIIRERTAEQLLAADYPYVLLVSPLMVETGQYKLCQRVCVVDIPEALQIDRAQERDQNSPEQIQAIMKTQASREQRLAIADDVIHNNGDFSALKTQVEQLHNRYLALASK